MAQNRDKQAFYDFRNKFSELLNVLRDLDELHKEYVDGGLAQRWTDLNQTEPTFFTDQGVSKAQMNDAIADLVTVRTNIDATNLDAKWRRVRN